MSEQNKNANRSFLDKF